MYSTYWNFNALIGVPGISPSCQTKASISKTGLRFVLPSLLAKTEKQRLALNTSLVAQLQVASNGFLSLTNR